MRKHILAVFSIILSGCAGGQYASRFTEEETESVNIFQSEILDANPDVASRIDLTNGVGTQRIEQRALIDTLFFLPLETTKASIFGEIQKVLFSGSRIIIKDGDSNLLIFDNRGKFVSKIARGNGPGEISKLWDIAYDAQQDIIIAYQSDLLSFYDSDGKFIKSVKCPVMFKEFYPTLWGYLFFQGKYVNYHLGREADYSMLLSDKDFSVFGKGGSTCSFNLVSSLRNICKFGEALLVSNTLNDTIFEVSGKSIKAKYVLNYKSRKANISSESMVKQSDGFYFTGEYLENSQTQMFRFWSYKNGSCITVRDKASGTVSGGTVVRNDERELPLLLFSTVAVHGDYFVAFSQPYSGMRYSSPCVSAESNEAIKNLTEDDNAVLIFYKIKPAL